MIEEKKNVPNPVNDDNQNVRNTTDGSYFKKMTVSPIVKLRKVPKDKAR